MSRAHSTGASVALAAIAAAGLLWWPSGGKGRNEATTPGLSVVPASSISVSSPAPADPPPAAEHADPGVDDYVVSRIRTAANDPDAILRNVTLSGDGQRVACGEIRKSNSARYDRFIWMAGPNVLAINDGGGAYAQFALLCDGKGMPAPKAARN